MCRPKKGTAFKKIAVRVTAQILNDLRHARAKMYYLAQDYRDDNARADIKVHDDKIVVDGKTKRDNVTPRRQAKF